MAFVHIGRHSFSLKISRTVDGGGSSGFGLRARPGRYSEGNDWAGYYFQSDNHLHYYFALVAIWLLT